MLEFFTSHVWLVWTLVALVCLILELSSGDFFIICFTFGAIAAAILSGFGVGTTMQIITFAAVSVLCILFVRPVIVKYFHRKDKERPSNADALMGRIGTVSQDIVAGDYGRVAIDGDDWKAESADGSFIPKGTKVKVVARESIIITVETV